MGYTKRVTDIIKEFENKLQRELSTKEVDFINWMVKSEEERKKIYPLN